MADANALNTKVIEPVKAFAKSSQHLLNRCSKPDKKGEFMVHVSSSQLAV